MNAQLLILPLPHTNRSVLILTPEPTLASLEELERELAQGLQRLRQDLAGASPTAGEVEYASWLPPQSHWQDSPKPQPH